MELKPTVRSSSQVENRYELANGMVVEHSYYLSSWAAKSDGATVKQGAIYVEGAKEPTLFDGILKYTRRDEDREMDAAWDAHNKLVVEFQRDEFQKVKDSPDYLELPESLRAVLDGKLKFSRYAGCSCPCSPGWLGTKRSVLGIGGRMNITNVAYEEECARKAAERKAAEEAKAAERGFESVKAMRKADAAEWQRKCDETYEVAAATARAADQERWAEMDAEAERQRLILADRYSEDLVAN